MPKKSNKSLTSADEEGTQRKASSGTIKSESGLSSLKSAKQIGDVSEASRRAVATMKVISLTGPSSGFSVANSGQMKVEQTRFPKLEEYAHFHYDLVEIPTLKLSLCTDDASGYKHNTELSEDSGMFLVTVLGSAPKSWLIKRTLDNFATLDIQLHRCIFDRKFSHLNDLSAADLELKPRQEVLAILCNYLTHLSELAGGMVNCGSVLSWMEMDNRGHRLVATDDSGINTPAIAAAHVVKRYNAQAADEITLQVGDMISVIDMPSADDTIWWRGKRGFEVGFFPAECVEIIGDKIPISMATRIPEPVATASASRRPLMKKHGKLLSFLRTFFSHRPPRNQLKQSGIVKERVFGCDLGEHLLNSGHDVPLLLKSCTDIIEEYGIVHGIYRLSGITSNIQKLRLAFDEDRVPDLTDDCYLQDIHSISSLLKMYFRELPNPLLTYQLYDKFADAVRDEENKLLKIHDVVQQLPPPHYRTTEYLMRHLARVAAFGHETEMHSKNLAIVWAPNLLRSKELEAGGGAAALQGVGIQAVVTECLICYCDIIFSDKMPDYNSQDSTKSQRKARPKSLAISTPTRLLSLEEARERAFVGHMAPKKFIDVGGGPRNLPSKYHTVIDLPGYRKRAPSISSDSKPVSGTKKMSTTCGGGGGGGWKSIFTKPRSGSIKKSRKCGPQDSMTLGTAQGKALTEEDVHNWKRHLRSAKSAESLFSLMNSHSSHGSLSSRSSVSQPVVPEASGTSPGQGLNSKFQLSHKRSLSSDASAILHHCCSTTDAASHHQSPDDKGTQSFKRGDSARKALHRRLPSAPSTPHEDRKSPREMVPFDELAANVDMTHLPSSQSQHEGDMNIHAKINSRLLQVAEKSRSTKSQEELTSPLKRMAKCSPKGSKRAKGAVDFLVDSRDEDFSTQKTMVSSSDTCPNDSSQASRTFYSCFHDYAEIVSDEDVAIINTPDSQGAISVSSSGCNMQDVLDQIDTRLALNAKLFPRQGIGDTSDYRVGDPPLSFTESRQTVVSPGAGLTSAVLTTSGTPCTRKSLTEVAVLPEDLPATGSARELYQLPESNHSWQEGDSNQQQISLSAEGRQEQGSIRAADKAACGTATSTLVGRRHTEFIPSLTAASKDLHNLHELLNSLTGDDSQPGVHARLRVLPKNHKSSRNSIVQVHPDPTASKMSKQKSSTSAASFEPKFETPKVESHVAYMSAGVGSGGMSKCLSVPSDIARSLENVTESQSDLLSSVTISELSASINSFSNGLGQEAATFVDGAKAQVEGADRRHRRSTSLDSLTENDRLMTRTLREINSQMEAAFQHNKMSNCACRLDSLPQHQRLAVSDLELTSTAFDHHQGIIEPKADETHMESSENHLHSEPGNITTCSLFERVQSSADNPSLCHSHIGVASQQVSQDTLSSQAKEYVSEARDSLSPTCLPLNTVGQQAICDLLPISCVPSSQLSPIDQLQLIQVRQQEDSNYICCPESVIDQQSRLTEKQTHKQRDEHIVIETAHVVKLKPAEPESASQQYTIATPSRHHHVHSRCDIASVCTNRSSSSSSSSCTSSEDYDEVAELSEDVSQKFNFSLPVKNICCSSGDGKLTEALANSRVESVVSSTVESVVSCSERVHRAETDVQVSLTASDSTHCQVVRRQHSPRVEQRSSRFHLNTDGGRCYFDDDEDSVVTNGKWKPLFTSDSPADDTETCERMSSLCAAGLMSQRVRLSRDSSVSSLHSPDTPSPGILSASAPSPLATPVREVLPDLIQSTAQSETTVADNRRCSVPLQLVLYHPDEFSADIAASVSSPTTSSRCTSIHPSPSLTQVHSLSQTVVVTKSTLTKSATDNSLSKVTTADRTVMSSLHSEKGQAGRAVSDRHEVMSSLHSEKEQTGRAVSDRHQVMSSLHSEKQQTDRAVSDRHQVMSRNVVSDTLSHDFTTSTSHIQRPLSSDTEQIAEEVEHALKPGRSPDTEAQMFFLHNSEAGMKKEEAQNVVNQGREILMSPELIDKSVNQGREILMSPELIDKSEQREKPYPSLQSPSAVSVRRTSFSKIPRPKQTCDLTSPRSTNNGGKKTEFLYLSSMTSSAHVDRSPSSSSSSTSSSSRIGHARRGSEASSCGSTTKRQCHFRRSSDTKLSDLQTPVPGAHSSSNKPDFSATGPLVTSPQNHGSDNKTGLSDIGAKTSRIPLSHRMPSPQSNRGKDATSLGISKQTSKIPSPIPKPRKLNLSPKGNHAAVHAEGNSSVRQPSEGNSSVSQPKEGNSSVRQRRTDISGTVASSKATTVRKDAECSMKKTMIVTDLSSRSGATLVIESQSDVHKAHTVHATRVSQPTRQVAAGSDPAAEPTLTSLPLADENRALTVTSCGLASSQPLLQAELGTAGGDKKIPPPVAARKFNYDSRSLPRRSKFLDTQMSFPGQQSSYELYTDMLGSRSSLDDSILQLAAERHDLFVPDIGEDGASYTHCLGSLRVKRSQKMQSLMDLFEQGSDSAVSDNAVTHSPSTQHRVRTCSASLTAHGGLLTPCVEAGLCDVSAADDVTFLPSTSQCGDIWSGDRFPSRAGTGPRHNDSSKETLESGGGIRAQEKYYPCVCSVGTLFQGRDTTHGSAAEQLSIHFKQIAETSQCSSSSFDETLFSDSLKPPLYKQFPESRIRSNSSSDSCTVQHTNVFSSRPSSFSGVDLQLQDCGHPHLTETHQPPAFDRQHFSLAFIDQAHRQSDRETDMVKELFKSENAHTTDNELNTTVASVKGSSVKTPPSSPRKNPERRNSIKELRQLFERADADGSTAADGGLTNPGGEPMLVRSRVRSVSPRTDEEHEARRDRLVRHSLEISTSVPSQSFQSEVKVQPLRLGPKPFYGAQK